MSVSDCGLEIIVRIFVYKGQYGNRTVCNNITDVFELLSAVCVQYNLTSNPPIIIIDSNKIAKFYGIHPRIPLHFHFEGKKLKKRILQSDIVPF